MHSHLPPLHVLLSLGSCGLLLTGAVLAPASAVTAPAAGAGPARPAAITAGTGPFSQTPTALSSHLTDDANLLDDAAATRVIDSLQGDGVGLWVVTMSDDSTSAQDYAAKAWDASHLGASDLLLVINTPPSGSSSFAFGGMRNRPVWSDSTISSVRDKIHDALSKDDYDGAVSAVEDGASSASGGSGPSAAMLAGGGTAAAVGGGLAAYAMSRRRNRKRNAAAPSSAGAEQVGPDRPQVPLETLRTRAGEALVKADDAVRAADEELSYAQAQFGLSATDAFTQALNAARDHLARSFELRRLLDDDIPETEPQQRQMYTEILQRCTDAVTAITAQEEEFNKRRGLEANLPTTIAETAQRAQEAEQVIRAARTLLVTLHATYPDSALTSVSEAPERAGRLLSAGRTALDQARASLEAGQHSTAVEQVRIAQGTIAQAGELAAQVTSARERLERAAADLSKAIASISSDLTDAERLSDQVPEASLAPLVADAEAAITEGRAACGADATGDPLAALDHLTRAEAAIDDALAPARAEEENDSRARASLEARLTRLGSQVDSVTSYITTHRGAVGPSARTALSEAARHASAAFALRDSDPSAALTEVAAGEPLAAQAQTQAQADVQRGPGSWNSSPGGGAGGINLGSLLLGGLLLGGGSNHGDYGGWGGHSHGGFFDGGGFDGGGGFFDGGGFDGGGGSF